MTEDGECINTGAMVRSKREDESVRIPSMIESQMRSRGYARRFLERRKPDPRLEREIAPSSFSPLMSHAFTKGEIPARVLTLTPYQVSA